VRKRRLLSVFVLLAFVVALTPAVTLAHPSRGWITMTAYAVALSHWDEGLPHYVAYFSGDYGRNQHFLGTGGDAATAEFDGGIAAWDWHPPTSRSRLLLPKMWLIRGAWRGAGVGANYQAEVLH
jgi:hypothetical protein